MTQLQISNDSIDFFPIAILEDLGDAQDWDCFHLEDSAISFKLLRDWGVCAMDWLWIEGFQTLKCSASTNLYIPDEHHNAICDLILMINEQMAVGHFDLSDDGQLTFRYSLLIEGLSKQQCAFLIEKTVTIAFREWDRYHAAFHFVAWGGADLSQKVISHDLIETVGWA